MTYTLIDRFPPGKSGGLIEARTATRASRSAIKCFRRVNPAASLKPACVRLSSRGADCCFRRVNPAASLKHRILL